MPCRARLVLLPFVNTFSHVLRSLLGALEAVVAMLQANRYKLGWANTLHCIGHLPSCSLPDEVKHASLQASSQGWNVSTGQLPAFELRGGPTPFPGNFESLESFKIIT